MNIESIWNKKLSGVPALLVLVITRFFLWLNSLVLGVLVRNAFDKVGRCVRFSSGLRYRYPGHIRVGNFCSFGKNVILSSELESCSLTLEDDVVIGRNCKIDFSGTLLIRQGSLLSEGVIIQTHDHRLDPRSYPKGKGLTIGKNVWLGLNSMILSNVDGIGDNAIVAAGSVVTHSVPANAIVAGIPAKVIKFVDIDAGG